MRFASAHVVLVALAATLAACGPRRATTEPTPPPASPTTTPEQTAPMTATMARVAAEAADGYRTGRDVYVMVTPGPNPRPRVFTSRAEAFATAGRIEGAVVHTFRTPQDTITTPGRVLSVEVRLLRAEGDTVTWSVPVDSVDMIAWSMPAIEKFVVPYYTKLYGADYAQRFRSQYFDTVPYLLYCHDLMSIECPTMETQTLEGFEDR